jgi:hypothetical protein
VATHRVERVNRVQEARRAPTRIDLDPTEKARTYSKGNRQKVALIAAPASDVELLLLDEPTAGPDPLMEAAFREYWRLALLAASSFAAWVGAAALDRTVARAERLLDELVDAQLVEVHGKDTVGQARFCLHDLVRLYARERAAAEEPEASSTPPKATSTMRPVAASRRSGCGAVSASRANWPGRWTPSGSSTPKPAILRRPQQPGEKPFACSPG